MISTKANSDKWVENWYQGKRGCKGTVYRGKVLVPFPGAETEK